MTYCFVFTESVLSVFFFIKIIYVIIRLYLEIFCMQLKTARTVDGQRSAYSLGKKMMKPTMAAPMAANNTAAAATSLVFPARG